MGRWQGSHRLVIGSAGKDSTTDLGAFCSCRDKVQVAAAYTAKQSDMDMIGGRLRLSTQGTKFSVMT